MQLLKQRSREIIKEDADPKNTGFIGLTDNRTLESVCVELFSKFETRDIADRERYIDGYFNTMVQNDEMSLVFMDPTYYVHLKSVVKDEVMPLYDNFNAVKEKIIEKQSKRSLWKYVLATVGICEAAELIITRGQSLRPLIFVPTALLEGIVGAALYGLVNYIDTKKLETAQSKLLNTICEFDVKHEINKRYQTFREYSGGDLLKAEFHELISNYESPDKFWQDYSRVRSLDPITERAREKVDVPSFDKFLELHISGTYSDVARRHRFDELFIMAQRTFMEDPGYILNHLGGKEHDKTKN